MSRPAERSGTARPSARYRRSPVARQPSTAVTAGCRSVSSWRSGWAERVPDHARWDNTPAGGASRSVSPEGERRTTAPSAMMSSMDAPPTPSPACSFCGRSQKQARKLVQGQGVFICDECVDLSQDIIEHELGTVDGVYRSAISVTYGDAVVLDALLRDANRVGDIGMIPGAVAALNRFCGAVKAAQDNGSGTDPTGELK